MSNSDWDQNLQIVCKIFGGMEAQNDDPAILLASEAERSWRAFSMAVSWCKPNQTDTPESRS